MISRYETINVDDALAGMVLCAAVLDYQGGVLLPKGTVLTDSHLSSLRRRGIDEVLVLNRAVSDEELAQECERVRARLAHLFRNSAQDSASKLVLCQLIDYRLEKLQ